MCQYSAVDGVVGTWHMVQLGGFALGGSGLVMAEASGVTPEGRISIACPGLWTDEHAEAFRPIVDFAHQYKVKIGIQLAHAGRKASTMRPWDDHLIATPEEGGWEPVSSSAIAFNDSYLVPRQLSIEEIHKLTDDFVVAAKRVHNVGFDVVEIHAAHGYLFHQFYSPLSNTRTDEYGGSFENRIRFLLETAVAVRKALPDIVLFVRISATDWVEGGWDIEQSVELAKRLKAVGVDLIDVSSGGNSIHQKIELKPGYQVEFSNRIRNEADIMTNAVGLITEATQAEAIVENGEADAVMLARAFLRNPHWTQSAAEELGEKIYWAPQNERGRTLT
jgi:2,4-dienoyl-CoA reductase-like NADH-dependent reductase (Old Yellow Enzyme family)